MIQSSSPVGEAARTLMVAGLLFLAPAIAWATDWPQYRGPATDGSTPDAIATTWATTNAGFVVWTNMSLTNGFSSFAVSQGRAFALISKDDGERQPAGVLCGGGRGHRHEPLGDPH